MRTRKLTEKENEELLREIQRDDVIDSEVGPLMQGVIANLFGIAIANVGLGIAIKSLKESGLIDDKALPVDKTKGLNSSDSLVVKE